MQEGLETWEVMGVDMETGHLMGRGPWCAGGPGDLGHDGYAHLVDMEMRSPDRKVDVMGRVHGVLENMETCDVMGMDTETRHLMGRGPWCAGGPGDLGRDGY